MFTLAPSVEGSGFNNEAIDLFSTAKTHDLSLFNPLFYPPRNETIRIASLELIVALPQSTIIAISPWVQVAIFGNSSCMEITALCIDDFLISERLNESELKDLLLVSMSQSSISIEPSREESVLVVNKHSVVETPGERCSLWNIFLVFNLSRLRLIYERFQVNFFIVCDIIVFPSSINCKLYVDWFKLIPHCGC